MEGSKARQDERDLDEADRTTMPQLQLPLFPAESKAITEEIGVHCQDGKVVYVCGLLPVFQHGADDLASFRMFTSQMVTHGTAKAAQIEAKNSDAA